MSSIEYKLLNAKSQLFSSLGDKLTQNYLTNLKLWFRKVWTKDEFDVECRELLLPEQQHLHNEFFLAILDKITSPMPTIESQSLSKPKLDTTSESSVRNVAKKRKRRTGSEHAVFIPFDLYDHLPEELDEPDITNKQLHHQRFAVDDLFLPDNSLILGRLLVVAWEKGLTKADDEVCEILVMATQMLLKNIISAIIKSRKSFRTTNYGRFFYDVGFAYKDPTLINTATRQIIDDQPLDIDREISSINELPDPDYCDHSSHLAACESAQQKVQVERITMEDLYLALQDRNLIPCRSVYAINIERVSQSLN